MLPLFRNWLRRDGARDVRALEEAVRGGAGGEGERLSLLTVFRNWLRRDGARVLCGARFELDGTIRAAALPFFRLFL